MDIGSSYLYSGSPELDEIIDGNGLHAVFQPIINLASAEVLGHEGLIRGPEDSRLHMPLALFQTARGANRLEAVEQRSSEVVLQTFGGFGVHTKLFINVSSAFFTQFSSNIQAIMTYTRKLGVDSAYRGKLRGPRDCRRH